MIKVFFTKYEKEEVLKALHKHLERLQIREDCFQETIIKYNIMDTKNAIETIEKAVEL